MVAATRDSTSVFSPHSMIWLEMINLHQYKRAYTYTCTYIFICEGIHLKTLAGFSCKLYCINKWFYNYRFICFSRGKGFSIDLAENRPGFTLPSNLGDLGHELSQTPLDLHRCSLVGHIPESIDKFAQGSIVNFSQNSLSGVF